MKCARKRDDCRSRHEHCRERNLLARKPAHCLEAWVNGRFDLAISHPILSEYEEVVARVAARYPGKTPTDWVSSIRQAAHLYLPQPLPPISSDPDDEIFIECAVAAKANYLVTDDKAHLLPLRQAHGIPIVAATEFLKLLGLPENPA